MYVVIRTYVCANNFKWSELHGIEVNGHRKRRNSGDQKR